jgi:hypothetical protein
VLALAGQSFLEGWQPPAKGMGKPEQFAQPSAPPWIPCGFFIQRGAALPLSLSFVIFVAKGGSVAKAILMDEFHITVYALHGLAPPEYDAIRQVLDASRFKVALRRAVRTVLRQYLPWDKLRVTVTQ